MFDKFTRQARTVMKLARDASASYNSPHIGTEHILIGLIQEDEGIAAAVIRTALERLGVDMQATLSGLAKAIKPLSKSTVARGNKQFTPAAKQALEEAVQEAAVMRHNYIGPEHLLLGILVNRDNKAIKILNNLDVDIEEIRNEVLELMGEPISSSEVMDRPDITVSQKSVKKKSNKSLVQFGRDLTQLAADNKLDPVIGRSSEIERVLLVLARRTKNNPILLGEPGVGKTAIVEGIAQQIVNGKAPESILNHKLISLDLAAMVAGTKYRGQFEERIKEIIKEATNSNTILFIDEIHTLVGAGGAEGAIDAANVLKPALSRGEIRCIGATTLDEYRTSLEKDGALERRFQKVMVEPPSISETEEILKGLIDNYQSYHKVIYSKDAIKDAVILSDRYITNRFLPDKAIDVIDEAGARAVIERHRPSELKEAMRKFDSLARTKDRLVKAQNFEEAAEIRDEMDLLVEKSKEITSSWKKKQKEVTIVDSDMIALTVAKMTGIPVDAISESEADKLLSLEEELDKTVIGQKSAKKALAKALRRSRAGLSDPKRPVGCFLFLGPTGVGKTLTVKEMTKILFSSKDSLISLDMSEYMEKHSVSKLTGAAPGYIGYEEGGQLTEQIKRNPYSIVLFDEIEKAHSDVYNILLQIMEEGHLTDSTGRKVSFKNTLVIMTSNIGSNAIANKAPLGFGDASLPDEDVIEKQLEDELSRTFKPEFLNRLDAKIIFRHLSKSEMEEVLVLELDKVRKRLEDKDRYFILTESAKNFLLEKGWNPDFGARPLRRAVSTYIEDLLAEEILRGSFAEKRTANIDLCLTTNKLIILDSSCENLI